jgi:transcriptional regulator with XRE-family HTH domain
MIHNSVMIKHQIWKESREKQKMTRPDLVYAVRNKHGIKIGLSTLSYYERGEQKPTFERALAMCDVLRINPMKFIGGVKKK